MLPVALLYTNIPLGICIRGLILEVEIHGFLQKVSSDHKGSVLLALSMTEFVQLIYYASTEVLH